MSLSWRSLPALQYGLCAAMAALLLHGFIIEDGAGSEAVGNAGREKGCLRITGLSAESGGSVRVRVDEAVLSPEAEDLRMEDFIWKGVLPLGQGMPLGGLSIRRIHAPPSLMNLAGIFAEAGRERGDATMPPAGEAGCPFTFSSARARIIRTRFFIRVLFEESELEAGSLRLSAPRARLKWPPPRICFEGGLSIEGGGLPPAAAEAYLDLENAVLRTDGGGMARISR